MPNFLKTHWLTLTVGLVCTSVSGAAAFYFVKQTAQESKAVVLKMEETLKASEESLAKSSAETASFKEALSKEKAHPADLKNTMAETETELEQLRGSLKATTLAAAKLSKAKPAKPQSVCHDANSKISKERLSALQSQEAELHRRENEFREKQKKLDDALNKLAAEKRKLQLQNTEYRWPHNAEPAKP